MKTKLSSRFWVALTLFSLVGQVAWVVENMYFNVFIYKMFRASAADISAMVGASSVAATVTTVLIGALSDRIGKRKLLICGGYLVWGISILSFCLLRVDVIEAVFPMTANAMSLGVSLVIIMDCVMTFFGSSANDAAFNAWVTDSTDHTNRGAVEGINSMMPLISIFDHNRVWSTRKKWIPIISLKHPMIMGISCFSTCCNFLWVYSKNRTAISMGYLRWFFHHITFSHP